MTPSIRITDSSYPPFAITNDETEWLVNLKPGDSIALLVNPRCKRGLWNMTNKATTSQI